MIGSALSQAAGAKCSLTDEYRKTIQQATVALAVRIVLSLPILLPSIILVECKKETGTIKAVGLPSAKDVCLNHLPCKKVFPQ